MRTLLLSLTLIWALSTTGAALECQSCTTSVCNVTAPLTCSSETMCITASIQTTSGGAAGQQIIKACASSSVCPATGSQTFSVNLGVSSSLASALCCDTDNCNSAILPFPAVPADNSRQCYSCNSVTSDCTTTLQCKGTEDHCFQATVTNGATSSPAFGCASTNLCAAASSLGTLPFMQNVGTITDGPVCCLNALCNTLTTTAATTTTTTVPTTATAATTTAAPKTTTTVPTTTTAAPTTSTTIDTTTTEAPTTTTTTVPTTASRATTTTTSPTTSTAALTTTTTGTTTTTTLPTTTTTVPTTTTTTAPTTTTAAPTTTT
ncbi:integumentary mucin C.1-like, partial [Scophthalmus maximus]|uniref:integumentary mucin C.1-like n=1 Tax=Scophthalmus maximus TaxID=52904 RepID=UPI001FA87728